MSTAGEHVIDVFRLAWGDWFGHSTFTIAPPPPPTPAAPGIVSIDGVNGRVISFGASAVTDGVEIAGFAVYDPNYTPRVFVESAGGSCTSDVSSDGRFDCTLPNPGVGTYPISVTETIAGVLCGTSVHLTIVDDTPVPPVAPSVISVAGVNAGVETVKASALASGLVVSGVAAYDPNNPGTVTARIADVGTSCSATVAPDGGYSCTLPAPAVGAHELRVTETIAGVSDVKTIKLVVTAESVVSPALLRFGSWSLAVTDGLGVDLSSHNVTPGESIKVTGHGLGAAASVVIELHSTPVVLASLDATGGEFARSATIPADTEIGNHTLVVLVSAPGYADDERDIPITVSPADVVAAAAPTPIVSPPATSTPSPAPTPEQKASGDAPTKTYQVNNTAKHDPSYKTILSSLPTIGDIRLGPPQLAAAGSLIAGLVFLIALPAILLEATLRENYDRIFRWAGPVRRVFRPLGTRITSHTTGFWAWVTLYTLIVGFILSFADPKVAPDLTSLRLVLALVIAQVVHDLVLVLISGRLAKSSLHMPVTPVLRPGGLIFVVAGVILTRALGLEPGVLFGAWLVLMALGSSERQRGSLALLRAAVLVGVGLIAWAGYSLLAGGEESFWSLLGVESLSAVMVGALSELVIAMLPMAFLEGHEIWEWSKRAWFATYIVVAALFAIIVLPQPESWIELRAPTIVLGVVFGSFGVLCIGVWAAFRFTTSKVQLEREEERDAAG
ncbi:MAG TPA: hypothetical protein VG369_02810 [Humibacter sp.]|nr:hypothetical protein [Humibacter sp.]